MEYVVKIQSVSSLTHDVKQFRVDKPAGYVFVPGEATEVAVNSEAWKNEKRPFTFTSLPGADYLELVIKTYATRNGVTHALDKLAAGDELIIGDPWGAISYKGEGTFIAGGAGITPFIAILRDLYANTVTGGNKLYFSNKTKDDVILQDELREILGDRLHLLVTQENAPGYSHDRIDKNFLEKNIRDFKQPFYLCGPDKFVQDIQQHLVELGANPGLLVYEK
jgi:ferredoxin-NADP reductase